jgi:hypothetical protein
MNAYKTISLKSAPAVAAHSSELMLSDDGLRKAVGRYRKNSLGRGRFEVVLCWKLCARANGRWVTEWPCRDIEAAREWIGQEVAS